MRFLSNNIYFNLKPSLIKTDIFSKLKDFKLSCLYYDRKFSNEYSKNFKSCYLNNFVCVTNNSKIKKSDKDDMTIVTGFINIPH